MSPTKSASSPREERRRIEAPGVWPGGGLQRQVLVGNLRTVAGNHPGDPRLAALIGTPVLSSAELSAMWSDHRIQPCAAAEYELHHPLVGRLTVLQQTTRSVDRPDQVLGTHTAPASGSAAEALVLLAQPSQGDQLDRAETEQRPAAAAAASAARSAARA